MHGTIFIHDEDVLFFKSGSSGKGGGNFYGHGKSKDEFRRMKDEFCSPFHPSYFILHPFY
jgi:hypothetical protein